MPATSRLGNGRAPSRAAIILVGALLLVVVAPAAVSRFSAEQIANAQWEELRSRGALRVAMDPGWQPFSFFGETGWEGLDADLVREIARRLEMQVQPDPVGYDSLYDALHLKRADLVASAVVVDPSRMATVAYTVSYFDAGVRVVTRSRSGIQRPQDLQGRRVVVVLGSDADRVARFWERRLAGVSRITVEDDPAALAALHAGTVDVALVDGLFALRAVNGSGSDGLSVWSIEPRAYAIAVRADNPRLLAALNDALSAMRADGTLQRLIDQWVTER